MNYTEVFGQLKTNNKYRRKSPHKAVLLLTIIYMYEHDLLSENKIYYDEKLKNTYYNIWNIVLPNEPLFHPDLYMPFWFLQNDKFWHIIPKSGSEERIVEMRNSKSKPSETFIKNNVEYVELDDDLYFLMSIQYGRLPLKKTLLENYTNLSSKDIAELVAVRENTVTSESDTTTGIPNLNNLYIESNGEVPSIDEEKKRILNSLSDDLQIAINISYYTLLKNNIYEREAIKEFFPTVNDLVYNIIKHHLTKNDISPTSYNIFENFLSDLRIELMKDDYTYDFIEKISEAMDFFKNSKRDNITIIEDNNLPVQNDCYITSKNDIKSDYRDNEKIFSEIEIKTHESRKGQPWTSEEEELITLYFNQGKDFEFIANKLGRTEVAIKSRLAKLGLIEYTYGEDQVTYIQQPNQDNNMEPFYVIGSRFDDLGHWLGAIKFWSLNEIISVIKIEEKWINKIVFSAKSHCAARGINYAEYFCDLPTDTLVTDYGLYHFFKAIPATPDIVPDTQHEVIAAQDYFEMPDPSEKNPNKFLHADPKANDFFLFPGDKVRILKEIGQSQGLMGATGIVQYHTYDTLSIIGPFQFFCNREDVELIERKKR